MTRTDGNILIFGGSRNIGYYAAIRLLATSGATVTFLLRSPTVFDKDEIVQPYMESGKTRVVKGDGLVKANVQRVWDEAGKERPVDTDLHSGAAKFHITKDKVGVERLIWHISGNEWPKENPEPDEKIIGRDGQKREGLPEFGSFKDLVIVRPLLLIDGECKADKLAANGKLDKKPYRIGDEDPCGYVISRQDVAHFIVEDVLKKWEKYRDEYRESAITLAY
ncbi:hypothetical protein M378DRAFT_177559 [Amanita muscaria Koide BX008]|uniref:NAD(P)-binding domain-containing protein n=1 Tax=Amanita muscaria (strain Koide BX008) TaxID=946122 RepID=A0A0C2WZ70_AMAMK|nr:hypothetical protein M378DRAFT_177559 [Amanita muscaria Koide BX008]